MKSVIPDLVSSAAFDPVDLARMQSVFDEVCAKLSSDERERRVSIAAAIFHTYSMGERERGKLLEVAMKAAK